MVPSPRESHRRRRVASRVASTAPRRCSRRESAILAVCCFFVAAEEKLTPSLFSELSALLLVCRLVYPLPYALDVDLVRTQVWLTGLYATIMVAACALYPETMQPLFA